MSSLARLAIVAVFVVGLSAAQGKFRTCPSPSSTSTDYFATQNCAASLGCESTRCDCAGGTWSNTTMSCTISDSKNSGNSCNGQTPCQMKFIKCMQDAAGTASCLSSLKVGIVNVLSSGVYNGSSLDLACRANTCAFFNASTGANCTIPFPAICKLNALETLAPGKKFFFGTLRLNGGWAFIRNLLLLNATLVACSFDLTRQLGFTCTCTAAVEGSLLLTFQANAASDDPTLLANLAAAAGLGSSWLTSLQQVFVQNGGTGTFGLIGLGTADGAASVVLAWSALLAVILAIVA